MSAARAVQTAWWLTSLPRAAALRRALRDPERAQRRVLEGYLRRNATSAFGREHGFAALRTPQDFQRAVPLRGYDEHRPWIERICAGEPDVLTQARVERLVPSSGSTAAAKLIPCTAPLRAEFARALAAWIGDLYRARPELLRGRAYWSISPAVPLKVAAPARLPVGIEDDSAYVGGAIGSALASALAVCPAVAQIPSIETFRYATALELLRARDLALVSVWHPSFLTLLLDALAGRWSELVRDVRTGVPSVALDAPVRSALTRRADPRRADELAALGPGAWREIWPQLGLVSCWTDAHAASAAQELARALPGVELQPKGLLATEAFTTLPFAGARPVALRSHFFEFLDAAGTPRLLHELRDGQEYALVVTTGGGLYRYLTRDRVRVTGHVERTPSLAFVGKEDRVSDRFGEKLDDGFVANALRACLRDGQVDFAMLAPDLRGEGLGYTLYLQTAAQSPGALAPALEAALCENPHYRYCRQLGQLAPLRVFAVQQGAHAAYLEHFLAAGQRLGDIKPAGLSAETGWSERFRGAYAQG